MVFCSEYSVPFSITLTAATTASSGASAEAPYPATASSGKNSSAPPIPTFLNTRATTTIWMTAAITLTQVWKSP